MIKKFSLAFLTGASALTLAPHPAAAYDSRPQVVYADPRYQQQQQPAQTTANTARPRSGGGLLEILFNDGFGAQQQQQRYQQQGNSDQRPSNNEPRSVGYDPRYQAPEAQPVIAEPYEQQIARPHGDPQFFDLGHEPQSRVAARGGYEPQSDAAARPAMDPRFEKQMVEYSGREASGTIVIDTPNKFLYLVQGNGRAMRYGVGVGRPGFTWAGIKQISAKKEWPAWTPPPEMLARRPDLPRHMEGGPENPLGARAMYLGSSMYRIHGSNEPWTIGTNVSSGCIRMRNEDVIDLYGRVNVGAKVVVI